ncbi:hypothetical protein E4U13_004923 [Claviceps humidiphila]|uniref:Uncharacterized protein n=1 Tax=Claviceps humidiphila TaxID=1294629 RepID=A0A9P7PXY1_9HYPO|nr:hypothetical protein E4U13_004923 [Claviceps humidiphila]
MGDLVFRIIRVRVRVRRSFIKREISIVSTDIFVENCRVGWAQHDLLVVRQGDLGASDCRRLNTTLRVPNIELGSNIVQSRQTEDEGGAILGLRAWGDYIPPGAHTVRLTPLQINCIETKWETM